MGLMRRTRLAAGTIALVALSTMTSPVSRHLHGLYGAFYPYTTACENLEDRLAQYVDNDGAPVFTHDDMMRLFAAGISPGYVALASSLGPPADGRLTDSIIALHQYCSPERLEFYASFCKENGEPGFSIVNAIAAAERHIPDRFVSDTWAMFSEDSIGIPGDDIINAYKTNLTPDRLKRLMPYFGNFVGDVLSWMTTAAAEGLSPDQADALARQLSSITVREKPVFTAAEMTRYLASGGTLDYARRLAHEANRYPDAPFNGMSAILYSKLGLKPDEVFTPRRSSRPGAVIVYPTEDTDPGAFYNELSIANLKDVLKHYDAYVFVAHEDLDLLRIRNHLRDVHAPPIELCWLAGHGDPVSLVFDHISNKGWLSFSDVLPCPSANQDCDPEETTEPFALVEVAYMRLNAANERPRLDVHDFALKPFFDMLKPDATIFLDSCMNAAGGERAANLANFVKRLAGNRTVYASRRSFYPPEISIKRYYPFRISIARQENIRIMKDGKPETEVVTHDFTYRR